jgi:hyperosmotically inducible protein
MKAIAMASLAALALALGAGCEKKKAEEAATKVGEAAKAVGETIAEGAKVAGEKIAEGAKAAWEATKAGAEYVGDKVAAGAKVVAKEAKDGWITTKVKTKIGLGKLFSVNVETDQGRVTLSGTVKTQAEKDEIEKTAKETDGVVSVTNKIVVQP